MTIHITDVDLSKLSDVEVGATDIASPADIRAENRVLVGVGSAIAIMLTVIVFAFVVWATQPKTIEPAEQTPPQMFFSHPPTPAVQMYHHS